jgi:hypothetical protein
MADRVTSHSISPDQGFEADWNILEVASAGASPITSRADQSTLCFKLISAGLARPHIANAVIGRMLGPFGSDQSRATLCALMNCDFLF